MKELFKSIIGIIAFLPFNFLLAQPGSLDSTFDTDGIVVASIGISDFGKAIAIQADGKIVAVGTSGSLPNSVFAVVRFNSDGSIDSSFSSDGIVTTDIDFFQDQANAVAIQTDGKIVVSGSTYNGADYDFVTVRYLSNGNLDGSFGIGGKRITQFGTGDEFANSIAIQSDGKIIVAGHAAMTFNYDFALVRYNTNGSVDNTFGISGKVTTDIAMRSNVARSIQVQSDGKIVTGGFALDAASWGDFALIRYNSNGSLDNSFSGDGIQVTSISTTEDACYALALQSDGKIVAAGHFFDGSQYDFAVARYNLDGSLDNSFSGDGMQVSDIGGYSDIGRGVAIQSNGKIIVAGPANNGSNTDFALIRYSATGVHDITFDTDGIVTTDIAITNNDVSALLLQNDGKIVLAGTTSGDFAIARYNSDAAITTSSVATDTFLLSPNAIVVENIQFSSTGVFGPSNTFFAEISDETGSFASATVIGSVTSDTVIPIPIQIPNSLVDGSNYRIRVRSDNPIIIGSDNGTNLHVIQFSNNISPLGPQIISPGSNGAQLNVSASHLIGVVHEWKYKVGAGSFTSFVPAETNTSYIPNFPLANDYEVTCFSVNMWNDTVQSEVVTIHVTNSITTLSVATDSFLLSPNAIVTENIQFMIAGIFNPGNQFFAEISDAAGSFLSPTPIGSIVSDTAMPIPVLIPNNLVDGNGYRIRVRSDNPAIIGSDNGTNLQVIQFANSVSPLGTQVIAPLSNGTQLDVSSTHYSGVVHEWKYKVGAGNFASFVPAEMNVNYLPNFGTINDYDVTCFSINMWNDTVQSEIITIQVTNVGITENKSGVKCSWQENFLLVDISGSNLLNASVEVFNLSGDLIWKDEVFAPIGIIPLELVPAMYMVKINTEHQSYHYKFIKT